MTLLYLGLALWCLGHLVPALAPRTRSKLMRVMGEGGYKGAFAFAMILSIVLIAFGWRLAEPSQIYMLPDWTRHLAMLIILVAFILMAGANMKSNLKRYIRHPQLTGFAMWAVGHLLANGDSRSLTLFLPMLVWALVEIWAINRRDRLPDLPKKLPIFADLKLVVAGLVSVGVFMFLHPYITGVALF